VLGVFVADRPQRLDLDERVTGATARPLPALARGGAGTQQVIEDLMVVLGGDGLDRRSHLVDPRVQRIRQ
jgi:hypothetical protein